MTRSSMGDKSSSTAMPRSPPPSPCPHHQHSFRSFRIQSPVDTEVASGISELYDGSLCVVFSQVFLLSVFKDCGSY